MASTIAAITTGIGGIVTTADATGNLSLLSGTSTVVAVTSAGAAVTGTMSVSGATTLTGGLNTPLAVTSGGTGVATSTGSGATVRGTSPTLTTPVINGFTGDTSVINIGSGQVYKDASGNVGIGTASPAGKLDITGANVLVKATASSGYAGFYANGATGSTAYNFFAINGTETARIFSDAGNFLAFATGSSATERMRIDSSGNVGIGITPIAGTTTGLLQLPGGILHAGTNLGPSGNMYYSSGWKYYGNGSGAYISLARSSTAAMEFGYATNNAGGAGAVASPAVAMTIDTSGNVLVGTTTASAQFHLSNAGGGGTEVMRITTAGGQTNSFYYPSNGLSGTAPSATSTVQRIWRDATTGRSINAAGTVNASGADYAEYMTKASAFTVAKGDVVGIDINGKLTNVFVDAISFCVKSTAPSYVGNDTWGAELEGAELEAARQTVDRIAFAGQVPVNVIGATAGQYIIPVNDNGAIKGQAVSSPTIEQYQQAVGKVIAIEADGRAQIIVKVA